MSASQKVHQDNRWTDKKTDENKIYLSNYAHKNLDVDEQARIMHAAGDELLFLTPKTLKS
jgi:hypothetical protein